jgi:signal transduction histidine kinase
MAGRVRRMGLMPRPLRPLTTLAVGFAVGLFLASIDKIMPRESATGPLSVVVLLVDWLAPPVAGALLGGALLVAVRYRRLLEAERAAAQVLAERLAGTERRQAIWVVAASIAHDLKNPLHNLQLLLEEAEGDPGSFPALLPRLRENLSRAAARLGELSRAGQVGGDSEEGERVELLPVLADLRARLEPSAQRSRTSLSVECPAGLFVRASPLALRSAVENVAVNSLDALQERGSGGHLKLSARALQSGEIELAIEDDGPGVSDSLRDRLFVPFASDKTAGTGLGLAISRALARASGGDLTLGESGPGRTSFRFTFHALHGQGPA